MQKISFKDKFGLTDLVLSKKKIQTRRIEKSLLSLQTKEIKGQCYKFYNNKFREVTDDLKYLDTAAPDRYAVIVRTTDGQLLEFKPQYRMREVVAVAQSYQKAYPNADFEMVDKWTFMTESAGWKNKMFVKPNLMPHTIKITNVRIEKLQDISDEDCLAEGVEKDLAEGLALYWFPVHIEGISWEERKARSYELSRHEYEGKPGVYFWGTPQEAYAALIDKIYGYGTWASNPYVFVYDFELVK
jgi:hypothetical protein